MVAPIRLQGTRPVRPDLAATLERGRTPRLRSLREFAEAEIVIPTGLYEGRRFLCARNPVVGLLLDEIQTGRWRRVFVQAPAQSGKTLGTVVIPTLYHLFELRETVVLGAPDGNMAMDKWEEDYLPVIERTRYRELLPSRGRGSRGGKATKLTFRNGASLRFMTGSGRAEGRAGFAARAVIITELNKFDRVTNDGEADPVSQLIARTKAYGDRGLVLAESTPTTDDGRITREYSTNGTGATVAQPCHACGDWVVIGREQLVGWQGAADELEARAGARWQCPKCAALWTDDQRAEAMRRAVLVHAGQSVDSTGEVEGDPPATLTFGMHWGAGQNLLTTAAEVAAEEWQASRAPPHKREDLEKAILQYSWGLPAKADAVSVVDLEERAIVSRVGTEGRGICPPGTIALTVGVDLGKYVGHWTAVAWGPCGAGRVIAYDAFDVPSRLLGVEQALLTSLRLFRDDVVEKGWGRPVDLTLVDTGWQGEGETFPAYEFVAESGARFMASKGVGGAGGGRGRYAAPTKRNGTVANIGQACHVVRYQVPGKRTRLRLVHLDSDEWKTWVHRRLTTPIGQSGAMTLWAAPPIEHRTFAEHILAERQVEEQVPGRGRVISWHREKRANHLFDTVAYACVAGHLVGVRLDEAGLVGGITPGTGGAGGKVATSAEWFAKAKEAQR